MRAQRREEAFRIVRQAAAVCLGYPDRDVIATSGLIRAALAEKAPRQAEGFEPLLAYWESSDLSCIGLVTTLGEVVEDGLGWFGDARGRGDLLAAEADGGCSHRS